MFLVDTHCHLDLLDLKNDNGDMDAVIARAQAAGVGHIVNVSISLTDFPTVLKTAEAYPFVSASVGLHPNNTEETATEEGLVKAASHDKVIAIGETGLDYFRSTGDLEWQRDRFRAHIRAAKKVQKPLLIHMREATADTMKIMQEEKVHEIGGIMHCFSEDWECARKALEMNFHISFSGIVTFKNARLMQEVARNIPMDRMLVETDAPYLAPEPKRGKANEPSYVLHTAQYLANLRGLSVEALASQTTENFFKLFKGAKRNHV